jgi:hypothetical protein
LRAAESWVEASPLYARPFRSLGYAGSQSDGVGAQLGWEAAPSKAWALGLNYAQVKIDEKADTADLGFATASLRWMPLDWAGARPFLRAQVGGLTEAHSNDPAQARKGGLASQAGLGILLTTEDQPWAVDTGLDALTASSGSGLNLLQAHLGVLVRFGMGGAAGK